MAKILLSNGIIEHNLVKNTIGYNIQIKHQNVGSRNIPGMTFNGKTIIRHNVLSKESNASAGGNARPNLLLGNFPASGDGSEDVYEVYGNFIWQNPNESLFQGSGHIAFYDNICVNTAGGNGVTFQEHNSFKPRRIQVFHNTILSDENWCIRLSDTDDAYQKFVTGNAVFTNHDTPIRIVGTGAGTTTVNDNVDATYSAANDYVNRASDNIADIDLYPVSGSALHDEIIDGSEFEKFSDYSLDFNFVNRNWTYRGAYSGDGENPGWNLSISIKPDADSLTTDVAEIARDMIGMIFPNPTANYAQLRLHQTLKNVTVTIIDLNGRTFYNTQYARLDNLDIDLSGWPEGMYIIHLRSENKHHELKLLRQ